MSHRTKICALSTTVALAASVIFAPQSLAQDDQPAVTGGSSATCALALGSSIPLGLAALGNQLEIPFVESVQSQIDSAAKNANTSLQQGLGIHNDQAAAFSDQVSRGLGGVVEQVGPVVGVVAAGAIVLGACGSSLAGGSSLSSRRRRVTDRPVLPSGRAGFVVTGRARSPR